MTNAVEKFEDANQPQGFSWGAYKIETEGQRATMMLPCQVNWAGSLASPETMDDGSQKWSVGLSIHTQNAAKLIADIRDAEQKITAAAGVKGPFPSFLRDGAHKDASGLFAKAKGRLEDFHYFTSKTKRTPRVVERGTNGGYLEIDPATVAAGGYCYAAFDLIVIGHGSDQKKGTSAWLSRLLWMGGGNQIAGAGSSISNDIFDGIPGVSPEADGGPSMFV